MGILGKIFGKRDLKVAKKDLEFLNNEYLRKKVTFPNKIEKTNVDWPDGGRGSYGRTEYDKVADMVDAYNAKSREYRQAEIASGKERGSTGAKFSKHVKTKKTVKKTYKLDRSKLSGEALKYA